MTITDRLTSGLKWLLPGYVVAHHPTIGTVRFFTGWCSWHARYATYFTPLGEVENVIDAETGAAILQHCRDWVDALVLVDHNQNGCDCETDEGR